MSTATGKQTRKPAPVKDRRARQATEPTGTAAGTEARFWASELDPRELVPHPDNRPIDTDSEAYQNLLASVKAVGVLVPTVVHQREDGYQMVMGHRRRQAAIDAGRPTIPCWVAASMDAVSQLIAMLEENDHREDLTTMQQASLFAQLAGHGLSPGQIAKRTGRARKLVDHSLTAAALSEQTRQVTGALELSLDQLAALSEFDGDTEAVESLTRAAGHGPWQFQHCLSRLRQDRQNAVKAAELTEQLRSDGIPVTPRPNFEDRQVRARQLTDLRDKTGRPLDVAGHTTCPGRAAYLTGGYDGPEVVYYCHDPVAHRHQVPGKPAGGSEVARQARREVIANNKAWRAATPVRTEFIKALLTGKTVPKNALAFITAALIEQPHWSTRHVSAQDIAGLLGCPPARLVEQAGRASDSRRTLMILARLAAGIEAVMGVHTWRPGHPEPWATRWLAFLAERGYPLSDVEQLAVTNNQVKRRAAATTPAHPADIPATEDDTPAGPGAESVAGAAAVLQKQASGGQAGDEQPDHAADLRPAGAAASD